MPTIPCRPLRAAAITLLALALGCSDSSGPAIERPADELRILRIAASAPGLVASEVTFWARADVDREASLFFLSPDGTQGEEFLRLRIEAGSLLARPDGTLFLGDDSVAITVRLADPGRILFEFEPSGLRFNPAKPAELVIRYGEADDDFNDDGAVDDKDGQIETQLAIWRQETVGGLFQRLGSLVAEDLEEIETELLGFSRYAIAY